MKDWANGWVKTPGAPIIKTTIERFNNARERIRIEQYSSPYLGWKFKTQILWRNSNNKSRISTVEFTKAGWIHLREQSDSPISFVFPNYQDYGYGIFLLDEKSRAYVLENIQTEKDDFLRSMMWGALWDSVRETELDPKDYVELVIKNLSVEQDEGTINTLLNRVGTAMNYYLSEQPANAGCSDICARLEALMIEKMQNAPTLGQRITFFRAFLKTASSETARKVLKEMLKTKGGNASANERDETQSSARSNAVVFPPLKTKDKFDIVTRLIVLGDKDALALLAELEKMETSDDAKRYAYAARAGIATAENKKKYWNDFVSNKDISESWIESAFIVFNSTRHSDLTFPYLEKALAELPNLKRSRKIFFVNGWLSAFIGGQKSEEAMKIVNKFLADNPNLDKDLRLKILENVDLIERAVKIRKRFVKNLR